MFQTSLGQAGAMHAASRAISGGPVYISDKPGEHNTTLLKKMVFEDGSVPRARFSAMPTLDCLFVDTQHDRERPLLSIWNENPTKGHGVVGVFNIYGSRWDQGSRVYKFVHGFDKYGRDTYAAEGSVRPCDCHALVRQENALVKSAQREKDSTAARHSFNNGTTTTTTATSAATGSTGTAALVSSDIGAITNKQTDAQFAVYLHNAAKLCVRGLLDSIPCGRLGTYEFELATITRVHNLKLAENSQLQWASVGLPDIYNSGGAIVTETVHVTAAGRVTIDMTVKGSGTFLALCTVQPSEITMECHGQQVNRQPKSEYIAPSLENDELGRLLIELPSPYIGQFRILKLVWFEKSLMS
jgi:Raffinose synthase or seed imbibition protein Sip1